MYYLVTHKLFIQQFGHTLYEAMSTSITNILIMRCNAPLKMHNRSYKQQNIN